MLLHRTDNTNPHFKELVAALDKELRDRYGDIQDSYEKHNKMDFLDTVILAYENDAPVGCGCFKKFNENSVEIKRMFVKKENRGQGVAGAILGELEKWAAERGFTMTVLETAKRQPEAIALYKRMGYADMEKYGPYVHLEESICMKKVLA